MSKRRTKLARRVALSLFLLIAVVTFGFWTFLTWRPNAGRLHAEADKVKTAFLLHKPVVAEFGSDKCAGCREMKAIMDALALNRSGQIAAVSVDALANRDYLRLYRIQALPTQVFFDAEGREISRHLGVISEEEILQRLGISQTTREKS